MTRTSTGVQTAVWAAVLVLANVGFGSAAATIGALKVGGVSAMSVTSLSAGVAGLLWLGARGQLERNLSWKVLGWIAGLNLLQASSYFMALGFAPAGPVAAIHLASPLVLLAVAVARGERSVGGREVAITVLAIAAGVLLATGTGGVSTVGQHEALGYALALVSAFAVAGMFRWIAQIGTGRPLLTYLALHYFLGGLLTLPVVVMARPPPQTLGVLMVIGALIYFPGNIVVFQALNRLTPVAVFAALAARILFATPLHFQQGVAMGCIALAALTELTQASTAGAFLKRLRDS
jgi:drug/metabolite transporter (DMT)-like permease